jgi:hypothetical protein
LKKALIHRYDNEPDILAVETNGCSDVYRTVNGDDFEIVIIVPTLAARTQIAVIADAVSGQYRPKEPRAWPGRPDRYGVRVDVKNVRYTTLTQVQHAIEAAGATWAAQWTVKVAVIGETLL